MDLGKITPLSDRYDAIRKVMDLARAKGVHGMSGECGELAVAMKHVLFNGDAEIVGGLNTAFESHGKLIGHFVVRIEDEHLGFIDLDQQGTPLASDDIEAWGMLDPTDTQWQEAAAELGFILDEEAAYEASLLSFDDDHDVLTNMPGSGLPEKILLLSDAMRDLGYTPNPSLPIQLKTNPKHRP